MSPRTARIAELNDLFRTRFVGGEIVCTQGIASLPENIRQEIIGTVRCFDSFTPDNDPHREHDFGAFDQDGAGKVFWKIDYYDTAYRCLSPDPTDPAVTRRVLTIMLASEY